MPQMNMIQALNSAMDILLARDPNVVVLGEDVGFFGGVFRVTDGLHATARGSTAPAIACARATTAASSRSSDASIGR